MKNTLTKIISISLSVIFFFTQVVGAIPSDKSIWKERKINGFHKNSHSLLMASLAPPLNQVGILKTAPLLNQPHTSRFNPISSPLLPPSSKLGQLLSAAHTSNIDIKTTSLPNSLQPPILIVQDIHLNTEAQNNIASLLQNLIGQKKIDVVGVEGAFGLFDFERFRAFSSQSIKERVAKAYLDSNLMGAPSYVGMTSARPLPEFIGIDDWDHYASNVETMLDGSFIRPQTEDKLKTLKSTTNGAKEIIFSSSLKEFDRDRTSYRENDIGLGVYLERLIRYSKLMPADIIRFVSAYKLEKSIDFNRVEQERSRLISSLSEKMDNKTMQFLLEKSLEYRDGRMGFGDYYKLIKNLCHNSGVNLSKFPAMDEYIQYALLADRIDAEQLQNQIIQFEKSILASLHLSKQEHDLIDLDEKIHLSFKLIAFELTANEWERYQSLPPLNMDMTTFENFYVEADFRSKAFIKNILSRPSVDGRVIIAGGFHTPLLSKLIRDSHIPFAVITPRITKIDDKGNSAYLSIFSRDKTPLDELFRGEKLFINPAAVSVGAGHPDTMASDLAARARMAALSTAEKTEIPPATGVIITGQHTGDAAVVSMEVDAIPTTVRVSNEPDREGLESRPIAGTQIVAPSLTLWGWARKLTHPLRYSIALILDPKRAQRMRNAERRTNIAQRVVERDPLTRVANEAALHRALKTAEKDTFTRIVIIDAYNFGQVNKISGQVAGDNMIKEVAAAIRHAAAESNVNRVFRLAGPKFVVLAPVDVAETIKDRAVEIFGYKELHGVIVSAFGAVGKTYAMADADLGHTKLNKANEEIDPRDVVLQDPSKYQKPISIRKFSDEDAPPKPETFYSNLRIALADIIDPETKVKYLRVEKRRNIFRRWEERDRLTKFGNRVALERALVAAEADPQLRIIVFDANNFKQVNKVQGRLKGDLMLTRVAAAIRQAAAEYDNERLFAVGPDRATDIQTDARDVPRIFRRGGDEFVIIARVEHAEEIKNRAEELFGEQNVQGIFVSLTGTIGKTFEEADRILQEAKRIRKEKIARGLPPLGSIWDKRFRNYYGESGFFYFIYTVFLVNWESILQVPVLIAMKYSPYPYSYLNASLLVILTAMLFSLLHSPKGKTMNLTTLLLGIAFSVSLLLPNLVSNFGWAALFVPMGLHSLYALGALLYDRTPPFIKKGVSEIPLITLLSNLTEIPNRNYWRNVINDTVGHQFSSKKRPAIEAVTNGIDAGARRINVEFEPGSGDDTFIRISDDGRGMTLKDIYTKLLVPKVSGQENKDDTIGLFGVGFYSLLGYLTKDQHRLILTTIRNGKGYKVTIRKVDGEPRVAIERMKNITSSTPNGTQVTVIGNTPSISELTKALSHALQYVTGPQIFTSINGFSPVLINDNKEQIFIAKADTPQGTVSLKEKKSKPTTDRNGQISMTVQGITVFQRENSGLNVSEDLVLDFPFKDIVPRSRNDIEITSEIRHILKGIASQILAIQDKGVRYRIINSYYPLIRELSTGDGRVSNIVDDFVSAWKKSLDPKDRFLPNIPQFNDAENVLLVHPELFGMLFDSPETRTYTNAEIILDGLFIIVTTRGDANFSLVSAKTKGKNQPFFLHSKAKPQNPIQMASVMAHRKILMRDWVYIPEKNQSPPAKPIAATPTQSKISRFFIVAFSKIAYWSAKDVSTSFIALATWLWHLLKKALPFHQPSSESLEFRLSWLPQILGTADWNDISSESIIERLNDVRKGRAVLNEMGFRHMKGAFRSSVDNQNTDPFALTRENAQNSFDAATKRRKGDPNFKGTLKINSAGTKIGNEYQWITNYRDNIGMTPEQVLRDVLIPGFSSKRNNNDFIGQFGQGFFTNLKEASSVVLTSSIGDGISTEAILTPLRNRKGTLLDVSVKLYIRQEKREAGTTISIFRSNKSGNFIEEQERLQKASAKKYLQLVDPEFLTIELNGEPINASGVSDNNRIGQVETPYGLMSMHAVEDGEFSLTHRRMGLNQISEGFDFLTLNANQFLSFLPIITYVMASRGLALDLPEDLELIDGRSAIVDADRKMGELTPYLLTLIFMTATRMVVAGDQTMRNFLPNDFAIRHYVVPQEIIDLGRKIGNGTMNADDWEDLSRSKLKDVSKYLMLSIPIFEDKSLYDLALLFRLVRNTPNEREQFLATLPGEIRLFLESAENEKESVVEAQSISMAALGLKDLPPTAWDSISQPQAYVLNAFGEWTSFIATELHRTANPSGKNKTIKTHYFAEAGGQVAQAIPGSDAIEWNLAAIEASDLMNRFQKVLDNSISLEEANAIALLIEIFDITTHELRHIEEGTQHSGDLTHDNHFFDGQATLLKLLTEEEFANRILRELNRIKSALKLPADGQTFTLGEYIDLALRENSKVRQEGPLAAKPDNKSERPDTKLTLPFWSLLLQFLGQLFMSKNKAKEWSIEITRSPQFNVGIVPIIELIFIPGLSFLLIPYVGIIPGILLGSLFFTLAHGLPRNEIFPGTFNFYQSPRSFALRWSAALVITTIAVGVLPVPLSGSIQINHIIPSLISAYVGHFLWNLFVFEKNESKASDWAALYALESMTGTTPNTKEILVQLVNTTPLILGLGEITENNTNLQRWADISTRTAIQLNSELFQDEEGRKRADRIWHQFSAMVRTTITNDYSSPQLTAGSIDGLLLDIMRAARNKNTVSTKKEVLVYQILKGDDVNSALKQVRDTVNKAKDKKGREKTILGFAAQDETVLRFLNSEFSKEIAEGHIHFIYWNSGLNFEELKIKSAAILNIKAKNIFNGEAKEFIQNAHIRILVPDGVQLPTDFFEKTTNMSRIQVFLLLTESLIAIQINPTKLDDIKRITETVLRQA